MRFPSGARVTYDCNNQAGPFTIEEPEWIQFRRNFTQLIIEVGAEAPEGELVVLIEPNPALHDVATLEPRDGVRRYSVVLPAGAESVMLRFGSWWVSRRFNL